LVSGIDNSGYALGTPNEMGEQPKLTLLSFYKIQFEIRIIQVTVWGEYFSLIKQIIFLLRE
jgi:hypothetical protein